ncbi:DUF2961 domain-containing protein [Luteolibacter sp. GHJ8]|uniref:DUF2961 domain-containing protein n=1 Tax=Luteolibacter rhizosphaerae TaxID=2989719 RepID=A0ABT3G9H8_9BACT|nr:glycoside hydrolase family 172 protein [Luteolibacter rhizosphaerae]MCW1916503.1 DUF2961 domain-containing protein [Luteolibacter rhizosphaerae]
MNTFSIRILAVGMGLLAFPHARAEVSLDSLLTEMADYSAVARWPEPSYQCLQASSHDRRTVAPDQPGWFANDDHTNFIRTETIAGRTEKVMLDAEGPGCLTRFWLTTVQNKRGTIRIYVDEQAEPVLSFPAYDLMAGELKLPEPMVMPHPGYTAEGNGGNTWMLPIPFAKRCKVTWEEQGSGPRYYIINYRKYAPGTKVASFSREALEKAGAAVQKQASRLQTAPARGDGKPALKSSIKPQGKTTLDLAGPAAIKELELRLTPPAGVALDQVLRSVIVRMQFDGQETVWCPAGDFFGSGAGLNRLDSWYRTVKEDGTLVCRWTMPFQKSALVIVENLGEQEIGSELRCETEPWHWDGRSMHFHAAWHYEAGLITPPQRDWDFVKLKGKGVYVGDVLSLYNEVATWYGEGDEKIRVDGEVVPSHLGTGTEDYYNYSFAPRGIMQTPFANQTRVDEKMTQGHNILTRTRNLDAIPYTSSLDFDIELISWAPTQMIYAATTYWYAFPGGSSNRKPQPEAALAKIPTLADAQRLPNPFPGAIDAEELKVTAATAGLVHEVQDMRPFGPGKWSRRSQLLVRGGKEGDAVTLRVPAPDAKPRKLLMAATKANDYGVLSFTVNGQKVEKSFDGYAPTVEASGEFELGTFAPVDGAFEVKVELSGTNPAAVGPRFYAGVDYVKLVEP